LKFSLTKEPGNSLNESDRIVSECSSDESDRMSESSSDELD